MPSGSFCVQEGENREKMNKNRAEDLISKSKKEPGEYLHVG